MDTCSSCHLPVKKVYSNSFRFGLETFNSFILEPKEHLRLFAGKAIKIRMDLTKLRRRQERERQKPVGLMRSRRSLQVITTSVSRFFVNFSVVRAQLPREMTKLKVYLGTETERW